MTGQCDRWQMNHRDNLLDVVEMILTESQREDTRDVFIVPAWMMRDLRVAFSPFVQTVPKPITADKSGEAM